LDEESEVVVETKKDDFRQLQTPWGLTHDVVTLPNQKQYYFFKLPHSVSCDLCHRHNHVIIYIYIIYSIIVIF